MLGFIMWWPVGLAILFFTLGSRKMGCWSHGGRWQDKMERMQWKMERMRSRMEEHGFGGGRGFSGGSSGNRAFDEYRQDTLRRLEEEQTEFKSFLERLRHAKDKSEFDQFMAVTSVPSDAAQRSASGIRPPSPERCDKPPVCASRRAALLLGCPWARER